MGSKFSCWSITVWWWMWVNKCSRCAFVKVTIVSLISISFGMVSKWLQFSVFFRLFRFFYCIFTSYLWNVWVWAVSSFVHFYRNTQRNDQFNQHTNFHYYMYMSWSVWGTFFILEFVPIFFYFHTVTMAKLLTS